jgi:hypothetical protein
MHLLGTLTCPAKHDRNRRSALRSARTAAVARVWRPRRRAIASQLPATTQPPAYISRISRTQEGLPENRARAMAQTPDGYLWLGTSGGLARFDGVRFVVYARFITPSMTDDIIRALAVSPDGSLWVATDGGGLLHYQSGGFQSFFGPKEGLTNEFVGAVLVDRRGDVWPVPTVASFGAMATSSNVWTKRFIWGILRFLGFRNRLTDGSLPVDRRASSVLEICIPTTKRVIWTGSITSALPEMDRSGSARTRDCAPSGRLRQIPSVPLLET